MTEQETGEQAIGTEPNGPSDRAEKDGPSLEHTVPAEAWPRASMRDVVG
ncbi:hypothetical protein [Amycolatopsis coloradensis]|nr:hypothetical protein [Amycolatopsis coloradensis]